jgi:hypothetical protein
MTPKHSRQLSEKAVWLWIAVVFICVVGILASLYKHEKAKPNSPHALVAAGFSQLLGVREWRPGMGTQPLMYHPAAFTTRAPLPLQTPPQSPQVDRNGLAWRPLPQ